MGIASEWPKQKKKRRHMGQRYAKHQMQSGVQVYHRRHYQQAIARWRTALSRLRNAEDRFITLGYMAQAFCDCSDYESMLHYALQQMELANARHDDFMKSEALLNLSKAYERLADYGKAVNYGRASLQHPNIDARSPGYAHLGIALAHLGLSQFHTALEEFERAMAIAGDTGDKLLELQICVGLGTLFTLLRDLSKALIFLRNALSILQLVTADNVHAKYKSIILYQLSVVLRLKGSLVDARQVCDETLRLAYQTSNRATYARALASMADINRELGESEAKETITKSWARYEQAFRIMRQIKDRMGETIVLGSMAKSASESRSHYTGQCECQAIQLNRKCLELAKMIGCKHAMLKCHLRLQELYGQLEDEDSEEAAAQVCVALIQEMELFCNFCGQRYGDRDDSLQALRCSHIFHEKCLHKFLAEGEDLSCPKCKRRAIITEDLTAKTTSAISAKGDEVESVALPSVSHPDGQSTSFATHSSRNLLKLTPLNIPLYDEQQHRQQSKDILKQQLILESVGSQQQPRDTTAPPAVATFAETQVTVRLPRTTSVPLADSRDIVYASSNYLREYGTTGDVFTLANRMIEDATDSLRSPPSSSTVAGSTMRTIKLARIRPKSSLCAGSSTSRVNELRQLTTAMEIGAESSQHEFSLSASTNSIAFYPSAMSETRLQPKTTVVEPTRSKIDDSGATSAASFSASTSGGSTEKNSPPTGPKQLPTTANCLPSRAERMCVLASARHFISEDTDPDSSRRMSQADSEKSSAHKSNKGPLELTMFKQSQRLGRLDRAETFDFQSETEVESTGPAKKKKPPPPPRKPCCVAAAGTFPSFSSELLDAPPPTLAFPTMLERAMRTVFEEDVESPNDASVVEYPPPPPQLLLSNHVGCATSKRPYHNVISQSSEISQDSGAGLMEMTSVELQNHADKTNCSDKSSPKSHAFVVRHGAGVTDL